MIPLRVSTLAAFAGGLGLLAAVGWASLAFGSLAGAGDAGSYGLSVVWSLRWPRTVTGLAVGAALAAAGCLMQAVTRNPLADPSVLGVNSGAAFAIVVAATLGHLSDPAAYVWFGFVGGAGAAALVWVLGTGGRAGGSPAKLALAGVVLATLVSSWTAAILLQNQQSLDVVRQWLAGSLGAREGNSFALLGPLLAAGLLGALGLTRALDLMGLGNDAARSLGVRITLVRNLSLGAVVWLTGIAVALAGPISFIGLAVPHLARAIVGPNQTRIFLISLVLGPVLLLGADVLGRVILPPNEIPVGIVTAFLGAPLLILFARQVRGERR